MVIIFVKALFLYIILYVAAYKIYMGLLSLLLRCCSVVVVVVAADAVVAILSVQILNLQANLQVVC